MNITNYKMQRKASCLPYEYKTEPIKMDASIPFIMSTLCSPYVIDYSAFYGVVTQDTDGGVIMSVDEDDTSLQGAYKLWLEIMKDRGYIDGNKK